MPKIKPAATTQDTDAIAQMLRIGLTIILANVIQNREPSLTLLQCKIQAGKQIAAGLAEDWIG